MARRLHKLTARKVETAAEPGRYSDGGGLYLAISASSGGKRWVFIFERQGRTREMGLGSAGKGGASLAEARKAAEAARELLRKGIDPIEARRAAGQVAQQVPTFGRCADEYIASHAGNWENAKHREQWVTTLDTYAAKLREMPVNEVDTVAVLGVLKPIWRTRAETASRLRGRIERILAAARVQGHRTGENPAAWRGHLDTLLPPARPKLSRGHHPAMPYAEVPAFMGRLREQSGIANLALEFCILTAARTAEVIGARWPEFDLDAKVWTVPAKRMKSKREHRVPLSPRAVAIVEELAKVKVGEFVFPGRKLGQPLFDEAMAAVLDRMGVHRDAESDIVKATVHGFRSSFRDWAGEETLFPREVVEAALAHVVGDQTERSYRRGDALPKRRELMDAWANYIERKEGDNVVRLIRSA